jgi:hypothetical protein
MKSAAAAAAGRSSTGSSVNSVLILADRRRIVLTPTDERHLGRHYGQELNVGAERQTRHVHHRRGNLTDMTGSAAILPSA